MLSPPEQLPLSLPLRESSSFESFVDAGNEALVAALQHLDQQAGRFQVYLWGDSGCGRSHLLEATVRTVLQRGGSACLLSGAEMLAARVELLDSLEQMQLVALDDVDLLAGKPAWEEALFHLYNRVSAASGALLFSASQPPAAAGFTLPDLASRLAAGPVFQLQALDDEARVALLCRRAAARGITLGEEVARYIAMRAPRSSRALIDCLDQLDRATLVQQRRPTVPFVRNLMGW